jgi:hypothetical protein
VGLNFLVRLLRSNVTATRKHFMRQEGLKFFRSVAALATPKIGLVELTLLLMRKIEKYWLMLEGLVWEALFLQNQSIVFRCGRMPK